MLIKRPRKPAPEQTRRSRRVSSKATIFTEEAAPGGSIQEAKVSSKEVPKHRDLKLLHKVFADDEDPSLKFYVTNVKYYSSFDAVCCFCVPYKSCWPKTYATRAMPMTIFTIVVQNN